MAIQNKVNSPGTLRVNLDVLANQGCEGRLEYAGAPLVNLPTEFREVDFDVIQANYGLCGAIALTQRALPAATTRHSDVRHVRWEVVGRLRSCAR